jgi:Antibiotic biosynthesis monooxygenase
LPRVLVVSRFRVPGDAAETFRADLERALSTLAACGGYLTGRIGRNVDDDELWVLVTTWDGPGPYRRALSSYDVKLHAVPVLGQAVDEPGAYEIVDPETVLNVASPRSS